MPNGKVNSTAASTASMSLCAANPPLSSGGTILCACDTTNGAALATMPLPRHGLRPRCGACRLSREVDRGIERIALDDFVEDAQFLGLVHLDVAPLSMNSSAACAPIRRGKTLRSAGTRQQAELDLGQADFRFGRRDAIVAREREFEAAAERVAFDRGDVDFLALLDRGDHVANRLGFRRRLGGEVVDVGAAREVPVGAGEHDCRDTGIGRRGLDDRHDLREGERKRVDRRIVERETRTPS